jgi:dipeptidyl aminopeptidase/acylaminoacyl peptidase
MVKALVRTDKMSGATRAPHLEKRPFHPKDLLNQVVIQSLSVAPDGSAIIYARRTIEDGNYVRRLWRTTFRGGRPEQITTGKANDVRPRFSPDGRSVVLISDRSGKPQVWLMPMTGGEPKQLTDMPNGVGGAEWSPDGTRLLLLAPSGEKRFIVGKDDDPIARKIRDYTWKIDGGGFRDEFTSVWVADAEGGKPWRLTPATYDVGQACWSPDGKAIAFLADVRPEALFEEFPNVWTLPAMRPKAETEPEELASLPGSIHNMAWSPTKRLAFLGNSEPNGPGWANVDLYVSDGKSSHQLVADRDLTIANTTYGDYLDAEHFWPPPVVWLDAQNVLGLVVQRGSSHPYRFGMDGSVQALAEGDVVCSAMAVGGGRIAVTASTDGPADVYAVEEGALRRLTTDGSRWFGPFHRRVERIEVPHPDGHTIDVWLMTAHGQRRRGPLVICIHGGPNLSHGPTPWLEMTALADAGFHVLWPNPRGSTGYGEAYARAISGDWGGPDSTDVLQIVNWAVEKDLADRDRLGIYGLSYGGFLTNWMLGSHPGLFGAAVSENPVTDMLGEYATADFGLHIGREAAGVEHPWEHLNDYLDHSPYTRIHKNHSPLLLLQAEADLRCPPGNSEMVFTILRSLGREVEMVRYPGESHLMLINGRPDRRVDRIERIVAWFKEHLGSAGQQKINHS